MQKIGITAVFEPCEEGGFIAYIQEIPGINTQGEPLEEAKENLTEAVNLVFDEIRNTNSKIYNDDVIKQIFSFNF